MSWCIRPEGSAKHAVGLSIEQIIEGVEDGSWSGSDEARGPGESIWRAIEDHPTLAVMLPPPKPKATAHPDSELDMTPMIDMTFQLLIFFMITASFTIFKALNMPEVEQKAEKSEEIAAVGRSLPTLAELEEDNLLVTITDTGEVMIDDVATPLEGLGDKLRELSRTTEKSELMIDAASGAKHETVVAVIDAAAEAQIQKVHFIQRPGESGSAAEGSAPTPAEPEDARPAPATQP